jgi:hypothetical protein
MIVRAIRIREGGLGREVDQAAGLTIGDSYPVLEVICAPRSRRAPITFRILDDARDPTVWASDCFEVIDSRLPSSWIVDTLPNNAVAFTHYNWRSPEFWQELFNDPTGRLANTFSEDVRMILAESGFDFQSDVKRGSEND